MTETKEKKKKEAVLTQSTELAEIPLQSFTAKEINSFEVLCYKIQKKHANRVWIDFDEYRELTGNKRRGDEKLLEELRAMSLKFSQINLIENKKSGFKIVVPFIDFEADTEQRRFSVGVHDEFVKALNDLDGLEGRYYTRSDLRAITAAKSTYTKHCLKMLYVYRDPGKISFWHTTVQQLKYYLDIPENYTSGNISQKVLSKIESELKQLGVLEVFEIRPRKDNIPRDAGRRKIIGYTFIYKFKNDFEKYRDNKKEDGPICPKCGKPLVRKRNKKGEYFFGHPDGGKEGAECSFTMNEVYGGSVKVKEQENDDNGVTRGELEAYYRHLREEAFKASLDRKDEIQQKEPDIWEVFERRERMFEESIKMNGAFTLSDESREQKKVIKEEIQKLGDLVKTMLEEKGYGKDYMQPKYKCDLCGDTGQKSDGEYCSCRKERVLEVKEWQKSLRTE